MSRAPLEIAVVVLVVHDVGASITVGIRGPWPHLTPFRKTPGKGARAGGFAACGEAADVFAAKP